MREKDTSHIIKTKKHDQIKNKEMLDQGKNCQDSKYTSIKIFLMIKAVSGKTQF